jgi:hypothetical protein
MCETLLYVRDYLKYFLLTNSVSSDDHILHVVLIVSWSLSVILYSEDKNTKTKRKRKTKNSRGLNPQANYTDRATAACRRS